MKFDILFENQLVFKHFMTFNIRLCKPVLKNNIW